MNKNAVLKVLNPILAIMIVVQMVTGLLHSRISHEMFEVFHEFWGKMLFGVIILHVVLNWTWVTSAYFRKTGRVEQRETMAVGSEDRH